MLKIKDNVDLKKELVSEREFTDYTKHPINSYCYGLDENDCIDDNGYIAIGEDKTINILHLEGETKDCLDMIYDLIKADLVEKVEANAYKIEKER